MRKLIFHSSKDQELGAGGREGGKNLAPYSHSGMRTHGVSAEFDMWLPWLPLASPFSQYLEKIKQMEHQMGVSIEQNWKYYV